MTDSHEGFYSNLFLVLKQPDEVSDQPEMVEQVGDHGAF